MVAKMHLCYNYAFGTAFVFCKAKNTAAPMLYILLYKMYHENLPQTHVYKKYIFCSHSISENV